MTTKDSHFLRLLRASFYSLRDVSNIWLVISIINLFRHDLGVVSMLFMLLTVLIYIENLIFSFMLRHESFDTEYPNEPVYNVLETLLLHPVRDLT